MIDHTRQRLPDRVSYITSPGNGDGPGYRKRRGLPRGGPAAIITTKAVLRFGEDAEAYLHSHHPGVAIADVVASTGWKLRFSDDVSETPPPSPEELRAIREYDKEGFWTS
jgi:glutaconate CoA-transferase subunit B